MDDAVAGGEARPDLRDSDMEEILADSPARVGSTSSVTATRSPGRGEKRAAEQAAEDVGTDTKVAREELQQETMDTSSGSGLKRQAELAAEDLRDVVDVEDLVSAPVADECHQTAPGNSASSAACLDACSFEVIEQASTSLLKGELYSVIASLVRDSFASKQWDLDRKELQSIASLCLELGVQQM